MEAILQSESSECGLACIAMVAAHHGQHIGLRELRRRHNVSHTGARLSQLIAIAGTLGFGHRPLRLEIDDLAKLACPCILHWDLNHFVVLEKVKRDAITILDPANGRRVVGMAEVSERFTGVALELAPGASFAAVEKPRAIPLRQLTGSIVGLRRSLALILLLSIALQAFVLIAPFFMQWTVDQVLVSGDRDLLTVLGIGFGLALLLQVGIGLVRGWAVIHLSAHLGMQWMRNVFAHLLKLPLDFFAKRHLGDVTSRMGAVHSIQRTLTTSFIEAVIDGMMAVATLAMMLLYSWRLALVTLLAVGLYLALRAIAFWPLRDGTEQQLVCAANQQSNLLESIRGIQSVKLAGNEDARRSLYANLVNETINRDVLLARLNLGFGSASQLIFGLERVAVIWIGRVLALQSVFSVGMLVAYLAYKDQFATRVGSLIDKLVEFRMVRLHGERLADIVLEAPEHVERDAIAPMTAPRPTIHVDGVGFRYGEGDAWVVRDCSFRVEEGESVAIVGTSGCGKTTLVKLVLGLLQPAEGSIRLDGRDIQRLGMSNYRGLVGAVMQEDQLFSGSIAENIAFGDDSAPDLARVEAAAHAAAIHDEIMAMPMHYHSLIGDMGTMLSGGQKQRVILARALYRNPKILVLDEATSHLDVDRERQVNALVRGLRLTRIVIAHRPETIASADRVLVMSGGRIVQEARREPVSA